MKRIKDFISGFVVCLLIFVLVIPVAATSISATLEYNNIKITLDGILLEPKDANGKIVEPFIIAGTTYLPVRAVSEALGLDVNWNDETKTVMLSSPGIASSGTYGRRNPAPVGTTQKINIDNYIETYTATITVMEIYRGEAAWIKIQEANSFNDKPEAGKDYLLVKIKLTASNVKDDKAISLSNYSFTVFSSDNVEYTDTFWEVTPNPVFSGDIYDGATLEGYAAYTINANDKNPKAVFGENYDGTGGLWFALYN